MNGRRAAYLTLQSTAPWQGAHTHVHEIIAGLRRRGWRVDLHQPDYPSGRHDPSVGQRLAQFLSVQRRLWAGGADLDLLYVRYHPLAFPTARWSLRHGITRLEEVNGTIEDFYVAHPWSRRLAPLLGRWSRHCLRTAHGVVVGNAGLAEWVTEQAGHERIRVIPNGVNTALFNPGARSERVEPGPYVAFTGALVDWEGLDTLLAAAAHPDWPAGARLVIAGDGPGRRQVDQAQAAGSPVTYLGPVPYEDVPGILAGAIASMSLNTRSRWGASPLKLYEAMACGVPVVASDTAGQAEVIRQTGCGVVVAVDDPAGTARAVARLVEDPRTRQAMGERGRAVAVAEHSWDRRVADVEDFAASLPAGGARRP